MASSQTPHALNIADSLNYLDAVKNEYQSQPEVYKAFTDLMSEFRNQLIDTPRVMERVVALFQEHPTLIQGFNTFLPPGYRIDVDVSKRPTDADGISITLITPTSTTTQKYAH